MLEVPPIWWTPSNRTPSEMARGGRTRSLSRSRCNARWNVPWTLEGQERSRLGMLVLQEVGWVVGGRGIRMNGSHRTTVAACWAPASPGKRWDRSRGRRTIREGEGLSIITAKSVNRSHRGMPASPCAFRGCRKAEACRWPLCTGHDGQPPLHPPQREEVSLTRLAAASPIETSPTLLCSIHYTQNC